MLFAELHTHYCDLNMDLKYFGEDIAVDRDLASRIQTPVNTNHDCNVSFTEHDRAKSQAQIKAYGDTWNWDKSAQDEIRIRTRRGT